MDKIVVLDFGSQYSHLICRRIRDFSVYAELVPFDISLENLTKLNPKGIIFSGGPSSVYDSGAPIPDKKIFQLNVPILGICYGHQIIVNNFGGKIKRANKEYGSSVLTIDSNSDILNGIGDSVRAWMSHGDEAEDVPEDFEIIGHTESSRSAAIANKQKTVFGIQFHPEVVHTEKGTEILKNFVLKVCNANQDWTMEKFVENSVENISKVDGNVLCGVSGGIDSTVAALLIHKAIGNRLKCVFVDNGLLRLNEAEEIENMFKKNFEVNFTKIDGQKQFLSKLNGVIDPEEKRKVIGKEFVEIFQEEAEKLPNARWLAQGTIYPDVIESAGSTTKKAKTIKSHHNVGGLPDTLNLKLVEPLRDLFKDEVRQLGVELGLPSKMVFRHPFPGPGLGVRILGEVKKSFADYLRKADAIFIEELVSSGWYEKTAQAFAVFLPVKSVGVMGDGRTYEYVVALRAVETSDFMTANWAPLPHELLSKISNRIINEVKGINRVVYDISGKPPATIEWE